MNRYLIGAAVLAVALAAGAVQAQYTSMSIEDTTRSATFTGVTVGTLARTGAATTSYGVGTALTNAVAVEYDSPVHMTTLAIDTTFVATDGTAEGETELLYVFPAGRIYILGAAIDAQITNTVTEATDNDVFVVGIGSTAANDDADLDDSGEKDIIDGPTLADGAVTLVNAWEADLTAGADSVFDGTGTAIDLHLNMGIADACITTANFTNHIVGTVTLHWVNLGDD